jgi:hypothetical protein
MEIGPRTEFHMSSYKFYLIPDGLRFFHFLNALIFSMYFFIEDLLVKFQPDEENSFLYFGFIIFFLAYLIIPAVLHGLLLTPDVLTQPKMSLPYCYQSWFEAIPSKTIFTSQRIKPSILSAQVLLRGRLKIFGHFFKEQLWPFRWPYPSAAATWMPLSSQSAGMLRVAMNEFFSCKDSEWRQRSRSMQRFLLHYCSPLWISYLCLILIVCLWATPGPGRILLCFAWCASSLFFLNSAVIRQSHEEIMKINEKIKSLPLLSLWKGDVNYVNFLVIDERLVPTLASLLTAVATTFAIMAVQALPPQPETTPAVAAAPNTLYPPPSITLMASPK